MTLTGDNGLIKKASEAQKENLKAEGLEKIQVEVAGSYDNNGQIDTNQLRTNLQHIPGITTENDELITNSTEIKLPLLVKISGNQYLIKADGSTKAKFGIDEYDVAKHPETYYGHYITNYNSPNDAGIRNEDGQLGKWQIFMADDDNIYLIASNYITAEYTGTKNGQGYNYDKANQTPETATDMWFSNILAQYNANLNTTDIPSILSRLDKQSIYHKWINNPNNQTINTNNEKAVTSMLDVSVWNGYNNTSFAKYAIGGPTIEMFCKGYNDCHESNEINANENNTYGYMIQKGNTEARNINLPGFNEISALSHHAYFKQKSYDNGYWLSSTSACGNREMLYAGSSGSNSSCMISYAYYYNTHMCFRPLVCLKSNVHLVENEDGETYSLELD